MQDEKRNETRVEKRLLVNISKDDGYESMGLTTNISREGMSISTTEVLPVDCEVSILIGSADETFTVKGQVIWSKEGTDPGSADAQVLTGIKITEAPDQYIKFLEKINS